MNDKLHREGSIKHATFYRLSHNMNQSRLVRIRHESKVFSLEGFKNVGLKKTWVQTSGKKNVGSEKLLVGKKFVLKKSLGQKKYLV